MPDQRTTSVQMASATSFVAEEGLWSGAPGVCEGDLAVLYRKSMSRVSVEEMTELAGMRPQLAAEVKQRRIGSDIPLIWRIISGDQGPFAKWTNGYAVRFLMSIEPPITLKELKAERRLRKWQDLRWNFRAEGREAIEIPEFAWSILQEMVEQRLGRRAPELN